MTTNDEARCAIWPGSPVEDRQSNLLQGIAWYESHRAGGSYAITRDAEHRLRYIGDTTQARRHRARLTTWLVDSRRQGEEWPLVTAESVERSRVARDLHPHERADRLLRHLGSATEHLGDRLERGRISFPYMAAVSESVDTKEIVFLIRYLEIQGNVEASITETMGGPFLNYVIVSVDGHARIAATTQAVDAAQVFVAMWFDECTDDLFDRGIAPGVEAAGYKPLRIDQKPDANKIDDEIIAEIRRSRFVVADFTHGEGGARGGVYYEAGFAYGLNIPVIFTCREDMFDNIHFDTRQYNHIGWKEPHDLVEPLKQRILARIGEGPGRQ